MEQNKKRENELQKLKRDMEEQQLQNESTIAALRKKQQEAANEMGDQLDQLSKAKAKWAAQRALGAASFLQLFLTHWSNIIHTQNSWFFFSPIVFASWGGGG